MDVNVINDHDGSDHIHGQHGAYLFASRTVVNFFQ